MGGGRCIGGTSAVGCGDAVSAPSQVGRVEVRRRREAPEERPLHNTHTHRPTSAKLALLTLRGARVPPPPLRLARTEPPRHPHPTTAGTHIRRCRRDCRSPAASCGGRWQKRLGCFVWGGRGSWGHGAWHGTELEIGQIRACLFIPIRRPPQHTPTVVLQLLASHGAGVTPLQSLPQGIIGINAPGIYGRARYDATFRLLQHGVSENILICARAWRAILTSIGSTQLPDWLLSTQRAVGTRRPPARWRCPRCCKALCRVESS